jgi:hypothetical protein
VGGGLIMDTVIFRSSTDKEYSKNEVSHMIIRFLGGGVSVWYKTIKRAMIAHYDISLSDDELIGILCEMVMSKRIFTQIDIWDGGMLPDYIQFSTIRYTNRDRML